MVMEKESSTGWQACGAAHVAVYGTLRAGGINDIARLQPGIVCMGRTQLTGSLFDLGWYPGLSLNGTQTVLAEVYPMDAALERAMDRIEGLWPQDVGEYTKQVQPLVVHCTDGGQRSLNVLVYEALPPTVSGKPVRAVRDWLAWYQSQGRTYPGNSFALNTQRS